MFPPDRASQPESSSSLAATRLPGAVQAKLTIAPGLDPLEQEADSAAEQVMRATTPALPRLSSSQQISRKCDACEEEDRKLQKKPAGTEKAGAIEAPDIVHQVLGSPGQSLDPSTRAFFEQRFGRDFGSVRVHTDGPAAESAAALNALAYTVGPDVAFGRGQYRPHTDAGRRLLAHELSHTIQQGAASHKANETSRGAEYPVQACPAEAPVTVRRKVPPDRSSHKGNDTNQLKSALYPTGKAHLFADQVASIYFGTKSYVPDQDDHKVLEALAKDYQYTAQRQGGLRGKVIGHADLESSSDPDNQELSFQRARWTAAAFKSYVADATKITPAKFEFDTEGDGAGFCMSDPDCQAQVRPEALAQYRRADVMIFTPKMPNPAKTSCQPSSGNAVKTLGEYIELVHCAEDKTGYDPRTMLALLRQMYYGKPWSATAKEPKWNFVIPCSQDIGNPKDKLGQALYDALHATVTIEGTDLGHVFVGLEAMTCPASTTTIEISKFGMGVKFTVDLSNESFATWGGDVGSAAGAYVACWMMTGQERATKGKNDCHQGSTPQNLMQYFAIRQSPSEDLEGDIAPFVMRAAENGACGGSQQQRFTPNAPISSLFSNFFYNRGPAGKTSSDRYACFAEAIGATVTNGQITNRASLIQKYTPGILSFAWAYYINLKKDIPRSDPIAQLLEQHSRGALQLFFDWLQARMRR